MLIELGPSDALDEMARGRLLGDPPPRRSLPSLPGVVWDESFNLVTLGGPDGLAELDHPDHRRAQPAARLAPSSGRRRYLLRAFVDQDALASLVAIIQANGPICGISIDLPIVLDGQVSRQTFVPAERIAHLLGADELAAVGMDGAGVIVAVVDGGICREHLEAKGVQASFSSEASWSADRRVPFGADPGHGTACAYDVCLAAPRCTLADVAAFARPSALLSQGFGLPAMLSDAVRAYAHVIGLLVRQRMLGQERSLVLSNSWEVDVRQDFPPESPLNYSHNPNHAFNRAVEQLVWLGADVVFSSGNRRSRENEEGPFPIVGANGHPDVLTVAAVDPDGVPLATSRGGPGTLGCEKPDVAAYSHFQGSEVLGASIPDDGTSAACALTAGVVAAIRSVFPYHPDRPETAPAALRATIKKHARALGSQGFTYESGWGVVDAVAVADALQAPPARCRLPAADRRSAEGAAFAGPPVAPRGPSLTLRRPR